MSDFTKPGIKVEKESDRSKTWVLIEDLEYYIDKPGGKTIIVPKGFKTDFASIPRPFWGLFPPATGRYIRAAVVHDYLDLGGRVIDKRIPNDPGQPVSFKEANKIFLEAMRVSGTNTLKRYTMFYAVELYRIFTGRE